MLAATLYPLAWNPRTEDSFPLSNFPMFSRGQASPVVVVRYAVALDADGGRRHVPPVLVANREVLQARAVILGAVARGKAATDALCRRIAGNVAGAGVGWADVVEVRIVTGRHDAVEYLTGRDTEGQEQILGRCEVRR